jgi:SAM-dependent methyltransferase
VGCSGGRLSALLVEQGHHVTGVDTVEVPGVRNRVHAFHKMDAAGLSEVFEGQRFDYVVAGDVLEHLADPRGALKELAGLLEDGGQLLVSVPNFGHWYPRVRVLFGVFGYDRRGILDETHLRFFTRAALRRLVASAGFDILEEWHTGNPTEKLGTGEVTPLRLLARVGGLLRLLRPQVFAYQNVLRCTPHAGASTISLFAPHGAMHGPGAELAAARTA